MLCSRCGFCPCICLHDKPKPPASCKKPAKKPCPTSCPRPPKNCNEAAMRLLMYYAQQNMECQVFPNTCCNWYVPYYGRNPLFPAKYMFNQASTFSFRKKKK